MKMMNKFGYLTIVWIALGMGCKSPSQTSDQVSSVNLNIQKLADGLHSPVAAAFTPDGLMLVCEQTGMIRIIDKTGLLESPFLDLQNKLVKLSGVYDERGLLGIALHPDYKGNGKFYLYYSAPSSVPGSDHQSVVSEFKVSEDPLKADIGSEKILLTIQQPESNHNGGELKFGPDGYLYIGTGDGGGAGDRHGERGNGQNLNTLLGKILRIDVNSGNGYSIPADNPFVGKQAKTEIWAYGLRNPWRFSFDRKSGALFAADVGQNKFEEVNIIEKGGNYGWKIMEATHCFDPEENCDSKGLKLPITEYDHDTGISITGGFVYQGKAIPEIADKYVFADWTGPVFFLEKRAESWSRGNIVLTGKPGGNLKILGFAEDNDAELYILTNQDTGPKDTKGAVYKLIKP